MKVFSENTWTQHCGTHLLTQGLVILVRGRSFVFCVCFLRRFVYSVLQWGGSRGGSSPLWLRAAPIADNAIPSPPPDSFCLRLPLSSTPRWRVSFHARVFELGHKPTCRQADGVSKHFCCCAFAGPALRFENPPRDLKVEVGQTARVTVSFTGSPPIVSCWIRNNKQVLYFWDLHTEIFIFCCLQSVQHSSHVRALSQ